MFHDLKEFFLIPVQYFQHAGKQDYVAIGVGIIVAVLYFRLFFRDVSGFKDDINNAGKIPKLHRDYDRIDAKWSNGKIMFWIILSVGSGVLAYHQLPDWLPQWFPK
jgi:hypothetical protein